MESTVNPMGAFLGFWMFIKLISLLGVAVAVIFALYCLSRIAAQLERIADNQERARGASQPAVPLPVAPIPGVSTPPGPRPPSGAGTPPPLPSMAPAPLPVPPPAPVAPVPPPAPAPPPVPRTTMPGAPPAPPVPTATPETPASAGNETPERPREDG